MQQRGGAPKDGAFFAQPGSTGLFRCSDDNTHNRPRGEFYLPGNSHDNTTQSQPSETSESSSRSSPEIDILAQFKSKLEVSNSHLSRIDELSSKLKKK